MKPVNTKLRSINTKFWDDSYIIELSPLEKYLFLYLLTNSSTNLAGVYEITLKKIAFDTGLEKKEIEKIFKKLSEDKKIIYMDGYLIIKNFLKNQSFNNSMIKNVEKTINRLPPNIKKTFLDFVNPSTILDTMFTDSNSLSTASDKILSEDKIKSKIENKIESEKTVSSIEEPTLNEVIAYFESLGHSKTDAENFYSYYSAQNWETKSGTSIKARWRNKVIGFMNNQKQFAKSKTAPAPVKKSITGKCICGNKATMQIEGKNVCSYNCFVNSKKGDKK